MRKTAKYYREELMKPQTALAMENLIKEVIAKYGTNDSIYLKGAEFNWNHRAEGFLVSKNGTLFVNIYWQGDSTDGNDCVLFRDVINCGKSIIRTKTFWDGYRTRYLHGDLKVTKEEVTKLTMLLANWLSPSAIKERKNNAEILKVTRLVDSKLGNEYFNRYSRNYGNNEEYHNACRAVNEWLKETQADLLKMSNEDILSKVEKIFHANYKNNHFFCLDEWGRRTKPYILNVD